MSFKVYWCRFAFILFNILLTIAYSKAGKYIKKTETVFGKNFISYLLMNIYTFTNNELLHFFNILFKEQINIICNRFPFCVKFKEICINFTILTLFQIF